MYNKYTRIRTDEQFYRYSKILTNLIFESKDHPNPELEDEIHLLIFLIDVYHDSCNDELLENIHLNDSE